MLIYSGYASVYGRGHYKSFDGKNFDYPNSCPNILVSMKGFTILTDKKHCTGENCFMDVVVAYRGNQVKISQHKVNQFDVKINSVNSTLPHVSEKGFRVSQSSTLFVKFESTDGINIFWDGKTRLYVKVSSKYNNLLSGLAGNFNGKTIDDFVTPSGDLSHSDIDFGNSWLVPDMDCPKLSTGLKLTPCEENHQNAYQAEEKCNIINSEMFKSCHDVLDPTAYFENCKQDVCGCGSKGQDCLCGVLAAYASDCAIQGMEINGWRKAAGCRKCQHTILFSSIIILQLFFVCTNN